MCVQAAGGRILPAEAAAFSSGFAVFKEESNSSEFYYSALRASEHYISLRADFSNFVASLEWAQKHDLEVQVVANASLHFAQTHLREILPGKI